MAEETKKKSGGKGAENTLGLIGSIAELAGPLLFGPQFSGVDLGAPFKTGANMLKQKREQESLLNILSSNPATAPIVQMGQTAVEQGGLAGMAMDMLAPQQEQVNAAGVPLLDDGGVDINSPQFVEALAGGGFGNQALQILFAQAQKKETDPLDQALKMMSLAKGQKELNKPDEPDFFTKEEFKNELLQERQELKNENQMDVTVKKEMLKPVTGEDAKIFTGLSDLEATTATFENAYKQAGLQDRTKAGQISDAIWEGMSEAGTFGRVFTEMTNPQLSVAISAAKDLTSKYVKLISGVAVSEPEFKRLSLVKPNALNNKENFNKLMANHKLYMRYVGLAAAARQRNKDIESLGYSRDEVNDFVELQKVLKSNKKFSPEENQAIGNALEALGLGGLYDPKTLNSI